MAGVAQQSVTALLERHALREVRKIGEGSYGSAVLVETETGAKRVCKMVDVSRASRKEAEDAVKEAKLLSSLKHPYIVRYRQSFADQGWLCILMDFCEAGELAQRIELARKQREVLAEDRVMRWFTQAILALKYLHDRHILHRDLKPSNFFLTKEDVLRMGDFGIAKVLCDTMACARTQIGTPYYLSPEVCQDQPYAWPSDMWAMGCILYEMCARRVPFEAKSISQLVDKICRGNTIPTLPLPYSESTRQLCRDILVRQSALRPSADATLRRPEIQDVIRAMLMERKQQTELQQQQQQQQVDDAGVPPGAPPLPASGAAPVTAVADRAPAAERGPVIELVAPEAVTEAAAAAAFRPHPAEVVADAELPAAEGAAAAAPATDEGAAITRDLREARQRPGVGAREMLRQAALGHQRSPSAGTLLELAARRPTPEVTARRPSPKPASAELPAPAARRDGSCSGEQDGQLSRLPTPLSGSAQATPLGRDTAVPTPPPVGALLAPAAARLRTASEPRLQASGRNSIAPRRIQSLSDAVDSEIFAPPTPTPDTAAAVAARRTPSTAAEDALRPTLRSSSTDRGTTPEMASSSAPPPPPLGTCGGHAPGPPRQPLASREIKRSASAAAAAAGALLAAPRPCTEQVQLPPQLSKGFAGSERFAIRPGAPNPLMAAAADAIRGTRSSREAIIGSALSDVEHRPWCAVRNYALEGGQRQLSTAAAAGVAILGGA